MSRLVTFHRILGGCEAGHRESWQAFLSDYTPIALELARKYVPSWPTGPAGLWQDALGALAAENFQRLRAFDHQAEREFLVDLRSFLLEYGSRKLDPSHDVAGAPTPEAVRALLKGLPLLHQEILFLKLSGYSDTTLEALLRITPAMAQKGLERLQQDYASVVKEEQDACLWPAAWSELLAHARASSTEACPPLRSFVRIQDGQTNWYDKEPLERHLAECLHCLERWTALRELVYWRREAKPRPAEEINNLLSCLPVQAGNEKGKSLLKRLFAP